jgi:hypothetical protein
LSAAFCSPSSSQLPLGRRIESGHLDSTASKDNNFFIYGRDFALSHSEAPIQLQMMTKGVKSIIGKDWIHHKVIKSRIPDKVFQPSPADHGKYGGDPQNPYKLHTVTRIKSTTRHPN